MLNAVIYARFSSDMQREESIDAQVRACKAYAKSKGYTVIKEYVDEAKSGRSTLTRDAYNQMMADAMENKFDVIIFHKIDRNSRNELNYFIFKNKLEKLGIRYEYAAQPIDIDSPEGQVMETVMVGMAAYYSRNLAKETKKGMNENAYKAIFNGGYAPLGYKIVDKHYVIDKKEAEAVRLIFNLYLDGKGYGEICLALAARGYTTRSGKNFPKNSLHDILRNERYMGTYTFNRVPKTKRRNSHSYARPNDFISIPDAIPAIVSKETFLAAQEKMLLNKKRKGGAYTAKRDYLLSGKFFCGYCGSAMQGYSCCTRGNMYYYYSCARKDRVPADRCKQKMIRAEILEHWVLRILERVVFTVGGMRRIADAIVDAYEAEQKEQAGSQATLLQRKAVAEKKLNNLYKIFEEGNADEFDRQRLNQIKAELREINKSICETYVKPAKLLSKQKIAAILAAMKDEIFVKKNSYYVQQAVDLLVDHVTITDKVLKITLSTQNVCAYLVPRNRTMTNRNILKPFILCLQLLTTIIAQSKRYLLAEFYQGVRFKINTHGVDIISGACRVMDSLQKRMSLPALIPVSNGNSHGLKLILYFYAFMI